MADDTKSLLDRLVGGDFEQKMLEYTVQKFRSSWGEQDRVERLRRFDYVVKLVLEREAVLKSTRFATAFCMVAIEGVINGDEKEVSLAMDALRMTGERPELIERCKPIFRKFIEICEEANVSHQAMKNRGKGEATS